MPNTHLTPMERGSIEALLKEGLKQAEIARRLGRSPSTISRELARNRVNGKAYVASGAQKRYEDEREACRRTCSLDHEPLRRYLYDKLSDGYSPEQISGRLWLDFPGQPRMRVSHETIYRSLYADPKLHYLLGYLRQRRPRRRKRGERKPVRPMIPNRVSIEARPEAVNALERFGDWEGDLILGSNQQGAVVTLVDRKSLYLRAQFVPSKHANLVAQAVTDALAPIPATWRNTITFDNGSEFAHHETMTQNLGIEVYFAHPYSSWERARNENTNGLLRQYLPKKTSFETLDDKRLQIYVNELNNRPRKKLSYQTPQEVFQNLTVALAP